MTQKITTHAREELLQINMSTTGHTQNYKGKTHYYVITTVYEKLCGLNKRTLNRYRKKIEQEEPSQEHPTFFIFKDDCFWYTERILELRSYNKERNVILTPPNKKTKEQPVKKNLREALVNWVHQVPWDFKCGANYAKDISHDIARQKMETLYNRISKRYPNSKVGLFYSTEKNPGTDGYHNHILIAVNGVERKYLSRTIQQLIKSIGTSVPECKAYDPTKGKDFLWYVTKNLSYGAEWYYHGDSPDSYSQAIIGSQNDNNGQKGLNKKKTLKAAKIHQMYNEIVSNLSKSTEDLN